MVSPQKMILKHSLEKTKINGIIKETCHDPTKLKLQSAQVYRLHFYTLFHFVHSPTVGRIAFGNSSVNSGIFLMKNLRLHRNISCPATQYFHFCEPSTLRFSGCRDKIRSGKNLKNLKLLVPFTLNMVRGQISILKHHLKTY